MAPPHFSRQRRLRRLLTSLSLRNNARNLRHRPLQAQVQRRLVAHAWLMRARVQRRPMAPVRPVQARVQRRPWHSLAHCPRLRACRAIPRTSRRAHRTSPRRRRLRASSSGTMRKGTRCSSASCERRPMGGGSRWTQRLRARLQRSRGSAVPSSRGSMTASLRLAARRRTLCPGCRRRRWCLRRPKARLMAQQRLGARVAPRRTPTWWLQRQRGRWMQRPPPWWRRRRRPWRRRRLRLTRRELQLKRLSLLRVLLRRRKQSRLARQVRAWRR